MCACARVCVPSQIRIHRAVACDFYLRVRSRPIIEHTTGARFAPFNLIGADVEVCDRMQAALFCTALGPILTDLRIQSKCRGLIMLTGTSLWLDSKFKGLRTRQACACSCALLMWSICANNHVCG